MLIVHENKDNMQPNLPMIESGFVYLIALAGGIEGFPGCR